MGDKLFIVPKRELEGKVGSVPAEDFSLWCDYLCEVRRGFIL